MKAICNNLDCSNSRRMKEFSDKNIESSVCPLCKTGTLLPANAIDYISKKDMNNTRVLRESAKRIESLNGIGSKRKSSLDSEKINSLEKLKLSYKDKFSKLSKAIKNDKSMQKLSSVDDDIISSDLKLKEIHNELKKIDSLFNDFNKEEKKSRINKPIKK